MQLTYRGINYEANPAQDSNLQPVAPVDLRYRGAIYRFNQNARAESLNAILKYRGATYSTQPLVEVDHAPAVVKTLAGTVSTSVDDQARLLTMRHNQFIKNRQQSLLSRVANQVGLETIGNYWNRIQGKIHPTFRMNYDRSHATIS